MSASACELADRCHGWSCVSCAACGVVAPCARPDCPSCGQQSGTLREASERRARKVRWASEGLAVRLPTKPAPPAVNG
jgi:hypothetical protein